MPLASKAAILDKTPLIPFLDSFCVLELQIDSSPLSFFFSFLVLPLIVSGPEQRERFILAQSLHHFVTATAPVTAPAFDFTMGSGGTVGVVEKRQDECNKEYHDDLPR